MDGILPVWIRLGLRQMQARRRGFLQGNKRCPHMRRRDRLALAIKLAPLLMLTGRPPALLFGSLDRFVHASPDLLRSGCGSLRFFCVNTALGRRFPLTDPLPHKGWAVGFPY